MKGLEPVVWWSGGLVVWWSGGLDLVVWWSGFGGLTFFFVLLAKSSEIDFGGQFI